MNREERTLWFHQRIDRPLADRLTRLWHRSGVFDAFFIIIAKWTPLVMLVLIAAASFGIGLTPSAHRVAVLRAGVAVVTAVVARIANEPVSRLVSRQRPFEQFAFGPLVWHDTGGGFPSNHATGAFALAVSMCFVPGYGVCLIVLAILLTLSRMYSGLHYLSDVIAGALHGTFWAFVFGLVATAWLR